MEQGQAGPSQIAPPDPQPEPSADTEGRATPALHPPEQPPTHEEYVRVIQSHQGISDTLPKIFRDLNTRVPGGFQSARLAERLEERHGPQSLGGILRSLREGGRNSPYFREVQTDFEIIRRGGGTEAALRREWQGRS
jgi:hypothetical protein